GSTGGGLKTTTVAVMLLSAVSSSRDSDSVSAFKKKIDGEALRKASAICTMYFVCAALSCLLILAFEPFSVKEVMFEVFSAIGTVGLTLGITPELTGVSKIILVLLMTGGRVGSLTVALALTKKRETVLLDRPEEKITVG
ncbi:MAG: potassium transporter TrkG, partial [Oscillospiraceae bacterium]